MNRTITMNLSGIIFHIEEDAYDKLNKYLSTIRSYFKDSEGRDEIMNDIESRIAEMLQEKVSKTKQAVLMMDVENIISIMGKPEDFAGENTTTEENKQSTSTGGNQNYNSGNHKRRRVFRDPDEKLLGGVCSGIASYFDFDPLWIRGAFAVSFFVFGTGFLLYLILWIIIPVAKTTAEKLEMRGEKVDVNNIGKAVNDEFEDFKKRMQDFGNEVSSKDNKDRIKSSARKATEFAGDVFHNMIKVVGKIVAILLIFIGVALMVGLLATIFGSGTISVFNSPYSNIHFSLYEFGAAVLPADLPIELVVLGLILFLGVPLLSIIYGGIRHLFGIHQKNKIVKYTGNILWLIGLGLMIYIGILIGNDFNEEAINKQQVELVQPVGNTLYLDVQPNPDDEIDYTFNHHRRINFGDWTMLSKDEKKYKIGYPIMNITASENNNFELSVIKTANGYNKKEASNRAKNIDYNVVQKDSSLVFDGFFDIHTEDKLRAQEVKMILKVPVGKIIYLSKRMEKIIFDIDNVNDALDSEMIERRWIMTKRGLECLDCDGLDKVYSHTADSFPAPPAPPALPESDKKEKK